MRYKSARRRRASDVRRLDGVADASARAERDRARGSTTASSTQAIEMYTYWNLGVPLLVVEEVPRTHQHPGHTHVVVKGTRRKRPARGATTATAPPETTYTLYRNDEGRWKLVAGIKGTKPTNYLNVNTLIACARCPQNEWGIIDQGTLEQMDARAPLQLQKLWRDCGATSTSLLSINEANSIVNGALTCVCIFRPFPTQVRIASHTTMAEERSLAFWGLRAARWLVNVKKKGRKSCLMVAQLLTPLRRVPTMHIMVLT